MEDVDRCLLDDVRHLAEAELDDYCLAAEELDDHLVQCAQLVRSAQLELIAKLEMVLLQPQAQQVLHQLVQVLLLVREQVVV